MKLLKEPYIAFGLLMLVALTCIQQLPEILDDLFSKDVPIEESNDIYQINLSSLKSGDYYISLGRPRHYCDILYNAQPIFVGRTTINDRRPSLVVGAGFHHASTNGALTVNCQQFMSGFKPRLSFLPKIYSYTPGIIIHNLRVFFDLGSGPIACLFLIAIALLNWFLSNEKESQKREIHFIVFSFIAFAYSISLAHYTRLIMSGITASQLHIILRAAFSIAMAALLTNKKPPSNYLSGAHLVVIIGTFVIPYIPVTIESFYRISFIVFPITTFYTLWENRKVEDNTYEAFFLKALLLSWGTAQTMDWFKQVTGLGYFAAPFYLWAITVFLGYRTLALQNRILKSSSAAKTIESFVHTLSTPTDLIKDAGLILHTQTCMEFCSIYVDKRFISGEIDHKKIFKRISCVGETSVPDEIIADAVETPILSEALAQGKVLSGIGKRDGKPYIIVPIGQYAAICLTTNKNRHLFEVGESVSNLNYLSTSISLIIEKIEKTTSLNTASLSKLKSTFGLGSFQQKLGAIFIDIADYSKLTEEFGEAYSTFVSSEVLPSLIQKLRGLASPEVVRGDEVLFVVCNENPNQDKNISEETISAVKAIAHFMTTEAQALSKSAGFGKMEYRIGFTVGIGTIVIDDVQARSSGDHVNKAKRLQDAAAKGDILTDAETITQVSIKDILILSKKSIIVKKNAIDAVKIGIKRAA